MQNIIQMMMNIKTIGLMQASDSWEEFDALFAKAMNRSNT